LADLFELRFPYIEGLVGDIISKSFCVLPWIHMNLNPDGAATLCCQSHQAIHDDQGRRLSAQTHSLQEIWNSSGMKDIRKRMAAGEQIPHCNACFQNEGFGRNSYRTHSNERWLASNENGPALREAIERSSDGIAPQTPMYFDLRLGNICNLKCTACKPLYSSQIEHDPVHSKWIVDAPYVRLEKRFGGEGEWFDANEMLDEIVGMADQLSLIQLAGGEPTINITQIAFLQKLCDTGRAADIDLEVVTNLSNVRPQVFEIFGRFKSLNIALSIDGTHQTYEYVRFPGKWASLTKNIERLREARPGVSLGINAVLQAVNAYNVVELFDWADSENISINLSIGRGLDHYNDFRILPLVARDELRKRFEAYFARKGNQGLEAVRQNVQSIFSEMDSTDISDEQRRERTLGFMHFVNDMDKSRRLSFKSMAPELYDAVVDYYGHWDSETRYA
jgi:sulfatase maturation enzyme AslB (radical SAM superfamily)